MISIATLMTRMGVEMLEPQGVNEKLDPRHGEAQH
jgi:hypothetical protein